MVIYFLVHEIFLSSLIFSSIFDNVTEIYFHVRYFNLDKYNLNKAKQVIKLSAGFELFSSLVHSRVDSEIEIFKDVTTESITSFSCRLKIRAFYAKAYWGINFYRPVKQRLWVYVAYGSPWQHKNISLFFLHFMMSLTYSTSHNKIHCDFINEWFVLCKFSNINSSFYHV